jgi:MFS family permease
MNRNFYWIVVTRFLLVLGVEIQAVLMGWQMYDLTHDPLQLGLVGLAEAVPALSLSLFAGLLVDRFNPYYFYRVMVLFSGCSMWISWHATQPRALYLAAMITGLARSFSGPSLNAFIPKIIPREQLKASSAWTTTAFKSATVLGPGLAGVLLALRGYSAPYVFAFIALAAAFSSLFMVHYQHVKVPAQIRKADEHIFKTVTNELLVGVRFVAKSPLLISAMSLDMFAVLFGGVTALLPVFAAEILKVGPQGLGWLRAAPAFGAILMGFYLIRKPISKHAGKILLSVVLGFGLCILVFGFSRNYFLSLFALAMSGALDSVSMVVRGAIVQLSSPDSMRGRIAAVNSIFIGSSNEIGEFESGVTAKLFGTIPSVIFGGCMTIVTVLVVYWKAKDLRELDLSKI